MKLALVLLLMLACFQISVTPTVACKCATAHHRHFCSSISTPWVVLKVLPCYRNDINQTAQLSGERNPVIRIRS